MNPHKFVTWIKMSLYDIQTLLPTYEYEQESENEVANVADDAVESRESERARDAPRMAAQRVVVAQILVATDVQQLHIINIVHMKVFMMT